MASRRSRRRAVTGPGAGASARSLIDAIGLFESRRDNQIVWICDKPKGKPGKEPDKPGAAKPKVKARAAAT